MQFPGSVSILLLCVGAAAGQTAVEYSATVTAGGTAGAAAGVKAAATSIGDVFNSLTKALTTPPNPAAPVASSATVSVNPATSSGGSSAEAAKVVTIPAAAFVAPPLPKPIDPAQATVGLDRADLLARCGVPSTQVAERSGPKFVETLWYDTTDHDTLEIKLVDNKVASVTRLSQKKPVSAVHL